MTPPKTLEQENIMSNTLNVELDFPTKQDLCDEIDRLVEQRDELQKKYDTHAELVKGLVEAGEKACQPEPDGLGGFVAKEFECPEIIELRKALTAYKKLKGE